MTTERSEDYETTSLTGLPLFTQPVPPVAERFDRGYPMAPVAHLSTMSTHPIGSSLDWSLVSALRAQASEQLSQAVAADKGRLNKVAQEELGRTIVLDLIETTVADRVNAGMSTLPGAEQDALARAVFDSLFRLGRLQPLVDDDRIENIIITGHDNVLLELTDGSLTEGPDVADSDDELIDFLVFLASRSEVNARGFSEAQPRLHLRLDGDDVAVQELVRYLLSELTVADSDAVSKSRAKERASPSHYERSCTQPGVKEWPCSVRISISSL